MNIYLAHLWGDFIIQNDWMQTKKVSSWSCLVHVATYMLPFLLCGLTWWQMVLIAAQHFIQDRTNFVMWLMKFKGSEKFATGPCAPWSGIITDNIIHITFIAGVVALPQYI